MPTKPKPAEARDAESVIHPLTNLKTYLEKGPVVIDQDGQLVESPDPELYRLASDAAFASPSAAASVIAARSASGSRERKVTSTGQTYRDWRTERLGEE